MQFHFVMRQHTSELRSACSGSFSFLGVLCRYPGVFCLQQLCDKLPPKCNRLKNSLDSLGHEFGQGTERLSCHFPTIPQMGRLMKWGSSRAVGAVILRWLQSRAGHGCQLSAGTSAGAVNEGAYPWSLLGAPPQPGALHLLVGGKGSRSWCPS